MRLKFTAPEEIEAGKYTLAISGVGSGEVVVTQKKPNVQVKSEWTPPAPGPEVKDVTYNDEPFEDGIDFHAEEYYAFDGTNVVYAEGDKMRVDQVVDGVRKTHDVEIFARPEHDSGIAYDPFSQAMNEKGFVRGADATVTLTLHGGVAGTADQVISRSVKLYFTEG